MHVASAFASFVWVQQSIPALQAVNVFFLLLPALLGRLLVADLSADFLQNLSSYLITGGKQKHWATKTNDCALLLWCSCQLIVPWWAGTDLAGSLLPWQVVVSHPLWEPAPGRTAGTPLWPAISIGHESNKSNQHFCVPGWSETYRVQLLSALKFTFSLFCLVYFT